MNDDVMLIGEGFSGDGANAAHVNIVMGPRNGPVGTAWATALATPSTGHVPFVAVAAPGVPLRPFTLFVNKAAIENDQHGQLTWGAAQAVYYGRPLQFTQFLHQ
jgi:5,6,7,8-tetrahydromethanopterin hydro-lyase